jgi:glutaminyl-peptide cyclotransferase
VGAKYQKVLKLLTLALLLLIGCGKKTKKTDDKIPVQTVITAPAFNADSAYEYVNSQVKFGPRVPNSKSHVQCGDYLISQLKKYGWEVYVQSFEATAFDNKQLKARNIIASINPSAKKRILLASHWDTRPYTDQEEGNEKFKPGDGANDGASGVGILIEIARTIQTATIKPSVGIDIILYDVEDYGQPEFSELPRKSDTWCLGSQYWSNNKHVPNYTAYFGILLDMVGAPNAKFAMEGSSMNFAGDVVRKVWNTGSSIGYSSFFIPFQADQIIDDHIYVNTIAKIPMIDIIEFNESGEYYFADYWHTHNDNMKMIDKNTLKAVGQTLLQVVYNE